MKQYCHELRAYLIGIGVGIMTGCALTLVLLRLFGENQ